MNPGPDTRLLERLRTRVLTALHTGRLAPGDRLRSVREVARELDVDPRTAMELYHRLADEGLVEVRPRSGVYMAGDDSPSPEVLGETARWVAAEVAVGSWQRRIPLAEFPEVLRTCLQSTTLVCACVDEIEDDRIAICREVARDFGMEVRNVEPLPGGRVRVDGAETTLEAALAEADIVVVTAYHEREVRRVLRGRDLPVVLTTLNPASVEEVLALKAEESRLVFAVVDGRAKRRLEEGFGPDIEVVTVDELDGRAGEGTGGPLVFTPAAADAVASLPEGAVVPRAPTISEETARALIRWMVRLNLRNAGGAGGG
jgi:DNA-binding transcriptional regulator YhcF (GntR family)